MGESKNVHFDRPAERIGIAGQHHPKRTTTFGKTLLAMLLVCMSAPRVAGQRYQHPRLWPPANIEPCLIQCPAQHVQMTGNRSSGAEMSYWGPQPILDFMSNSQLQTSAPSSRPTTIAVDVAAASGITTLMTSVIAVPSATRTRDTSFSGSTTSSMAISGAERALGCNIVSKVVVTLSRIALFYIA